MSAKVAKSSRTDSPAWWASTPIMEVLQPLPAHSRPKAADCRRAGGAAATAAISIEREIGSPFAMAGRALPQPWARHSVHTALSSRLAMLANSRTCPNHGQVLGLGTVKSWPGSPFLRAGSLSGSSTFKAAAATLISSGHAIGKAWAALALLAAARAGVATASSGGRVSSSASIPALSASGALAAADSCSGVAPVALNTLTVPFLRLLLLVVIAVRCGRG